MRVVKVEKLEQKKDTGCLTIKDYGNNHNFRVNDAVFVKNSADGRGSTIESVGGDSKGFTELDDVNYFADKLYRSLKYPQSRVNSAQERQSGDILFGGQSVAEISRDEIKWAKFLERQQRKFCEMFRDLFLLHLEFKGLKKEYDLTKDSLSVGMTAPSHYKEQMEQAFIQQRMDNYQNLVNNEEFSKYYLQKKYLDWTDEEIEDNWKGFERDTELKEKCKPAGEDDEEDF